MPCTLLVGGQWGDEAKGKIVSYLTIKDKIQYVVRAGVGPGAGHTVIHEGREYRFRQVPSAAFYPHTQLMLGAGVLINVDVLLKEIETYGLHDRIGIDYRATIIDPAYVEAELKDNHLSQVVMSTGSGHGHAVSERALRRAKLAEEVKELQPFLTDVSQTVNAACDRDERVLVEGTNGFLLSVLYGTYPYAVAKDSSAATVAADAGIGPLRVTDVIMVLKSFPTRVGSGPFPTEISEQEAQARGIIEYGTVTKRRRRVGLFDYELAKKAAMVNHPSQLALTFLDRIDPACQGQAYEQLSAEVQEFIKSVEAATGVKAPLLGTGPDTSDIIDIR